MLKTIRRILKEELLNEGGIRGIKELARRYKKAKIYFHQDLDGVTTAIGMKNYLEQHGINVVDAEIIQYGSKEFAIKKPDASGDVMPVLVDFAHGKPMFEIHTDHHDTQAGAEETKATSFKASRSNVETISQTISPKEIFPADDIKLISIVDSANFVPNEVTPEMVMNYFFKYDRNEEMKRNKLMMGLVTNKLLLAYKNKPRFLEDLVLNSKPSLLSILNNIRKQATERGYARPEEMAQHQKSYIEKRKESGVDKYGSVISQYGLGSMIKPGSYDRYTPFRNNPDADFLVTGLPLGMVQASCNPFKKDRALKGVNLGEIKDEVLEKMVPELSSIKVTFGDLKRISEIEAEYASVGFTFKDMMALYGGVDSLRIEGGDRLKDILDSISTKLYKQLSPKQKDLLDRVSVNGLDVIKANSGGHKCITNISGINYLYRNKTNPNTDTLSQEFLPIANYTGDNNFVNDIKGKLLRFGSISEKQAAAALNQIKKEGISIEPTETKTNKTYVDLVKQIQSEFVKTLRGYTEGQSSLNEEVEKKKDIRKNLNSIKKFLERIKVSNKVCKYFLISVSNPAKTQIIVYVAVKHKYSAYSDIKKLKKQLQSVFPFIFMVEEWPVEGGMDCEVINDAVSKLETTKFYEENDVLIFDPLNVEKEEIDEKWSEKYKKSINCNNPKGFSQRAHCQGRKKRGS